MSLELIPAKREDFKEISEIYANEFSKPPYNEPWTLQIANEKIETFSNYCDIWKIINSNKLIGFVIINPNQWFPGKIIFGEEIAIKQEFQCKGYGSEILKKIFKIYQDKGYETFQGIVNKNSKAFNIYKKLGVKPSIENLLIEKELK